MDDAGVVHAPAAIDAECELRYAALAARLRRIALVAL